MIIYELFEAQQSNINDVFWRWFGNSKVVKNGQPLIVYHGTNQTIDKFSRKRLGANTGTVSSKGFFFTEHPVEAGEYADMSARRQVSNAIEREKNATRLLKAIDRAYAQGNFDLGEKLTLELEASEQEAISGEEIGANILPVYLSIKNPLILDMKSSVNLYTISDAINYAKTHGYDGLRIDNIFDPVSLNNRPDVFDTTQWVAFSPNQIKSIFNKGTWSERNSHLSEKYKV